MGIFLVSTIINHVRHTGRPSEVDGRDWLGKRVALSSDGNRIAVHRGALPQ